ncbi:MAG: hypothetical protein KGJ57_02420 [Sphingomonadales bacterium]|nr:hypothetical protein [Sphingomonadales bacterium]MDE2168265.1 hypothetical protein [Sphingomonadales bacterium]
MRPAGTKGARRRGEPVWALVVILGGWIGVRVATWDVASADPEMESGLGRVVTSPLPSPIHKRALPMPAFPAAASHLPAPGYGALPVLSARPAMPLVRPAPLAVALPGDAAPPLAPGVGAVGAVGGHQLLWVAVMANLSLAYDVARAGATAREAALQRTAAGQTPTGHAETVKLIAAQGWNPPRAAPFIAPPSAPLPAFAPSPVPGPAPAHLSRWSGDAWLLWRRGGNAAPTGAFVLPSYGADQIGAVLRYRLSPASAYQPTLYGRAYSALNGTGEREAALGFAARPVPAVPVIAMAEGRLSRFDNGTNHLRPAVTLVTQLSPVVLPGKIRAETYVQGGYVGGPGATPFVDGQFRLEQIALDKSRVQLRVGGGVWGGAQQGGGRLDVGPGVTLGFATAHAGAHVSVDWRFRVAGHAMPASGPAVTLAAGF